LTVSSLLVHRDFLEWDWGGAPIASAAHDHIEELVRAVEGRKSGRDDVIEQSWVRCVLNHRLDPTVMRPAVIVEDRCLREHREAIDDLLRTARSGIETLYRQVAGLGYVLLLTDSQGITVDYIGDEAITEQLRSAGLYLGSDWNETRAGTNGTGTCIATGEALTVHQSDHFDAQHIPLSCTVAPIYDSTGHLAAVLDISALSTPPEKSSQYLALQVVKSFAHRIETANLIRSCPRNWIVKLTSNHGLAEVDTEYVLVLDSSGTIVGFNHMARRLLAHEMQRDWRRRDLLLGRPFSDFFDCDIDSLTRFVAHHGIERNYVRMLGTGRSLFIQVIPPTSFRILPSAKAAAASAMQIPEQLMRVAGEEPGIAKSLMKVARIINTNMSILVQGETGTGKEFMAKAIHASSARCKGPFVPVNCAALPENLIESELFGYESGSFTGALSKGKKGLIREAHGGTLFLDEIGDMPLASQTRLLRVLAEREVTPIGGLKPVPVDMRVVAATHRDLLDLIATGRFREDLYFRLNSAIMTLPPLRERKDLSWLVSQMLASRPMPDGTRRSISPAALALLNKLHWPGNIRELVNVIDFACALAMQPEIDVDDLPDQVAASTPAPETADTEDSSGGDAAAALRHALQCNSWNVSAAARHLGIDRTTMHRRMRRHGISIRPKVR